MTLAQRFRPARTPAVQSNSAVYGHPTNQAGDDTCHALPRTPSHVSHPFWGDDTATSLDGSSLRTRRFGVRAESRRGDTTVKYFGTAEEAAAVIVKAFENPNGLPVPLAT